MTVVPAASFKERLAHKRRDLVARNTFELLVPGYEDLYARYRILGYAEIRDIGLANERNAPSVPEGEQNTAADVLVDACDGLLEKTGVDADGKPIYTELGYRWTPAAARDLFEAEDLPDDATGRMALKAIFPYPHDMLMMTHFQEYITQADLGLGAIDNTLLGESRANSAAM